MKHKFLMTIGIMFGVGLLLCGIGGGVIFAEVQSFEYEGRKYPDNELTTDTITVKLPEDKPVYYNEENMRINSSPMEIIPDENVPQGEIHALVSHTSDYSRFQLEIDNEYYIWNDDMLYISEHPVNSLSWLHYDQNYRNDDFENFREILRDIKERKIYDYNRGTEIEAELHVNPADEDRLIKLNNSQSLITYKGYKQNYAPDPDNVTISGEDGPTAEWHRDSESESSEIQQEQDIDSVPEIPEVQQEKDMSTVNVVPVDPVAPNGNNNVDESYVFTYPDAENKIYTTE